MGQIGRVAFTHIYTTICKIASEKLSPGSSARCSVMTYRDGNWNDLKGGKIQEGGDIGRVHHMRNVGLHEAQTGIKIARRNINNLRYADDITLMAESEELKTLLMKVKEESEEVGLKLNIQEIKIMTFRPIISRQIDGETVETVTDFIFRALKSLQMVTSVKLKDVYSLEEKL